VDDIEVADGVFSVKGSPGGPQITLGEVAAVAYTQPNTLPPGMQSGLENTSRYAGTGTTHANSTQICTCEVNIETGQVSLHSGGSQIAVPAEWGQTIDPDVVASGAPPGPIGLRHSSGRIAARSVAGGFDHRQHLSSRAAIFRLQVARLDPSASDPP